MIKGVGKQIVLLNNTDSEIFEQAIFILKTGGKVPYQNMVKECERMISNHISGSCRKRGKNWWKIAFFMLLILSSLLIVYLVLSKF